MANIRFVSFILRSGLAVVFLYASIAAFLNPVAWVGYLPEFVSLITPRGVALLLFSIWELALSLWLLSNRRPFQAAIAAAVTLLAITVANILILDVVFRDVAIFFSALALAALVHPHRN